MLEFAKTCGDCPENIEVFPILDCKVSLTYPDGSSRYFSDSSFSNHYIAAYKP